MTCPTLWYIHVDTLFGGVDIEGYTAMKEKEKKKKKTTNKTQLKEWLSHMTLEAFVHKSREGVGKRLRNGRASQGGEGGRFQTILCGKGAGYYRKVFAIQGGDKSSFNVLKVAGRESGEGLRRRKGRRDIPEKNFGERIEGKWVTGGKFMDS